MWLTDQIDAENIGDPLARIINRHNPVGDVVGDTDAGDAIAALVGLGVYAFRQLDRWRQARRLRRHQAAVPAAQGAQDVPGEPADAGETTPASWSGLAV